MTRDSIISECKRLRSEYKKQKPSNHDDPTDIQSIDMLFPVEIYVNTIYLPKPFKFSRILTTNGLTIHIDRFLELFPIACGIFGVDNVIRVISIIRSTLERLYVNFIPCYYAETAQILKYLIDVMPNKYVIYDFNDDVIGRSVLYQTALEIFKDRYPYSSDIDAEPFIYEI